MHGVGRHAQRIRLSVVHFRAEVSRPFFLSDKRERMQIDGATQLAAADTSPAEP
jgi:hypothetical protein